MKTFQAQIEDFERLTLQNMKYVAGEAIQDVMEAAQTPQLGMTKGATSFESGKIPVAEAELINSLTSDGNKGPDSYAVAIAGFEIGDKMEFAWTAPHAMPIEVGTSKFAGRQFVGANARRFSEFVEKRTKEVQT
jgi:hypothetical protein